LPPDHLRAGAVKARRPRACAGGAKRSALHGAEHRCSIVVVMADAVDVTPNVITLMTAQDRHQTHRKCATISRGATGPAGTRERDQFAANIFRTNRTGSSGQPESQSSAFDAANTRRFSPPNILCRQLRPR
jgi:hypothetical protein